MNKNTGEVIWLSAEDGNYILGRVDINSTARAQQVFTSGRDEQDRCERQIQTQQGLGFGRRGRRSRGHGTRVRTAKGELDKFRPTIKCTMESGPRPW